MVSMLYFPDEHKYGVYLPLFGPLFFPLITALIREVRIFIKSWKKKYKKDEPDSIIQDEHPKPTFNQLFRYKLRARLRRPFSSLI